MRNINFRAFTLVELIVVITILAILGTIGFISFQGFSRKSRDSVRISDLNSIKKSLSIHKIESGTYIFPDNSVNITYSGATVWKQGTFGKESNIKAGGRVHPVPVDPLTKNEYTFSVTESKQEYQLGAILEGDNIAYSPIVNSTYASNTSYKSYIVGDYNGKILKAFIPDITYILAVPTLINGDMNLTDIQQIITNHKLAYNGYGTLPGSYIDSIPDNIGKFDFNPAKVVVFSGSLDDVIDDGGDDIKRVTILKELQRAYNGTILEYDTNFDDLLNTPIDIIYPSGKAKNLAIHIMNSFLKTTVIADNIEFPNIGEDEDLDTDGDGIPNSIDTDDDNDGISDTDEVVNGTNPLVYNLPTLVAHYRHIPGQSGMTNQITETGLTLNRHIENNISGFISNDSSGISLTGRGYYTRISSAPAPPGRVKIWYTIPPAMGSNFTALARLEVIGGGRRGCSKISNNDSMSCQRYGSSRISNGIKVVPINTSNVSIQVGGRSGSHSSKQGSESIRVTDFRVYEGNLTAADRNVILNQMKFPTVNLGEDTTIGINGNLTLTATIIEDLDSATANYIWKDTNGDIISGESSNTLTVQTDIIGNYNYSVTVADNSGVSATDSINIEVSEGPEIVAHYIGGVDQTGGSGFQLTGGKSGYGSYYSGNGIISAVGQRRGTSRAYAGFNIPASEGNNFTYFVKLSSNNKSSSDICIDSTTCASGYENLTTGLHKSHATLSGGGYISVAVQGKNGHRSRSRKSPYITISEFRIYKGHLSPIDQANIETEMQ